MTRPGDRLRAIASRLFAKQTMERVIEPILADLRCEYDAARARGLRWRARLGLVRSYVAFGSALLWFGVRTVCHPDRLRSDVARACIVSAVAAAVVTVALVIPPLPSWRSWQGDPAFAAVLSVTLVPQALPLSIPAGLCVAVLWAMRGKTATWRRTGMVLAVALGFSLAVWFVLEWMMPQGNQVFREMVAARLSGDGRAAAVPRGLNELGLSRLGQRSDAAAVRQYQLLWALCFASVPISLLAFGLARYIRRGATAVVLAIALSNAYFAILWTCTAVASRSAVPASVPAWTPNALFLLVGCALLVPALRPHAHLADRHGA